MHSQVKAKHNSFFLEAGGNAIYYSINYERILAAKEKMWFSGRAGIGFLPSRDIEADFYCPFTGNTAFKASEKFFIEFGLGVLLKFDTQHNKYDFFDEYVPFIENYYTGSLGVKFINRNGQYVKMNYTPFYRSSKHYTSPFLNWAGIGIGFMF